MKRSRCSEEQNIGILREQEAGAATADVCRKHGKQCHLLQVEGQVRRDGWLRCHHLARPTLAKETGDSIGTVITLPPSRR